MKILRMHHVQITVARGAEDLARRFYCGILGLEEIGKPPTLLDRGGFWLRLGDVQVHVGTEDGVDRGATKAHLAYEVDDLESWTAMLQQHGTEVLDSIPIPGYDRVELRDPFGNRVELIQRLR